MITTTQEVWEATMSGSFAASGKQWATVWHYRRLNDYDPPPTDAIDRILLSARDVWEALSAVASDDVVIGKCTARMIGDAESIAIEKTTGFTHSAGQITTDRLPSYAAVIVRKRSLYRGKRYQGFCRLPGVCESQTVKDILTSGGLTAWQGVGATMMVDPLDASSVAFAHLCILSRQPPTQLRVNPTTYVTVAVMSLTTRAILGRLSRRRDKVVTAES